MLFREEFAKQAMVTMGQIKAFKKLNILKEKKKATKAVAGVDTRAAVPDCSHASKRSKLNHPTA